MSRQNSRREASLRIGYQFATGLIRPVDRTEDNRRRRNAIAQRARSEHPVTDYRNGYTHWKIGV
ncbi:hypothetical protein K2P56_01180 [Patescibacteria group bacterium]|nr:hypothetical protein [Patescibacteria group bacterium]